MSFSATTQIPIASLTFLSRLKQRYDCGPLTDLTAAERVLLEAYDNLYPVEKLRAMHAAVKAGRDCITGADLMAFARRDTITIEEPAGRR
jgi:hypothetical protein